MAGPTASVILPNRLDERALQRVAKVIDEIADTSCGMDFAVQGHPFVWATGEDYEGQFTELGYSRKIGWTPQDQIMLIAMCNQPEDHLILADLCIGVSESIGGLIDFGGMLRFASTPHRGVLHKVADESDERGAGSFHIGDIEFLRHWKAQPEFQMIK